MQHRAHVNKCFIAPGVANVELSEMTGVSHRNPGITLSLFPDSNLRVLSALVLFPLKLVHDIWRKFFQHVGASF